MRLANTTFVAVDASGKPVKTEAKTSGNDYDLLFKFDQWKFETLINKRDTVRVFINGFIAFKNPRIEGFYSKDSGYELIFLA